jgi:hypothetical protein
VVAVAPFGDQKPDWTGPSNTSGDREEDEDDPDDSIDELEELEAESQVKFFQDTRAIRETIDKVCAHFFHPILLFTFPQVCQLAFVIIHSSTKLLPAWHSVCIQQKKKPCLIPHNVIT